MGGFAIGARVALLWQHNANSSSKLASIPRYDGIVRTAGWAGSARVAGRASPAGDARRRPAGDGGRPQNRAPHTASGAAGPPATGRQLGAFSASLRQSGMWAFHWWRSGNKKRTQNVSEYMLVLDVCLVTAVLQASAEIPCCLVYRYSFKRCVGHLSSAVEPDAEPMQSSITIHKSV